MFNLSLRSLRNIFDRKDKFVCSELVADAMFRNGIQVTDFIPVNRSQMMPEDFLYLHEIFNRVNLNDTK